jgi:hypothetical protein
MRIEEQPHGLGFAFEGIQQLFRKRRIKVFFDANLTAHRSGAADRPLRRVGTNRAIGFPDFAMMISSPPATRSTSRENCVLA